MENRESPFRIGVVEDLLDPLKLGRVRVRVFGVHTDNENELPTEDLPWAITMQGTDSAAISGIGKSPRLLRGSWVNVVFLDADKQKPMVCGTVAGIPSTTDAVVVDPSQVDELTSGIPPETPPAPIVTAPATPTSPAQTTEAPYIGSLTQSNVTSLVNAIAQSESGGNSDPYSIENSIGYIGKYQFGALALKTFGYINYSASGSNKSIIDNPANWTGKDSITSKEAFFAAHSLQESLVILMIKQNYTILNRAGILDSTSDPAKTAGLLMAAHLKGAGGAINYAKGIDSSDAYGTRTSDYYQKGYASIAGKATVEQPTIANISQPAVDANTPPATDSRKYDVNVVNTAPQVGFKDPSGQYPLKDHMNESDLNRLARGSNINKTIVGVKEAQRITGIPIANSSTTWDQSPVPYAAVYPNNQVIASEAGHIIELDDTPGAERVNIHHVAGTFVETDSLGNQVERVAGIKTIILEKDELVYIQGSGHVTIDGDHSILVKKALNIQVLGDANIAVSGNCTQEIEGNYNLSANNINIVATGSLSAVGMQSAVVGSSGSFSIGGSGTLGGVQINDPDDGPLPTVLTPAYVTVPSMPAYSPTITIPSPVTRQEEVDMILEGADPNLIAQVYQNAPTPVTQATDATPQAVVAPVTTGCTFDTLSYATQLTANYTLGDLCGSHPFPFGVGQHGLTDQELACNLKQLAINVIEPLRALYSGAGFTISSCFREAGSNISTAKGVSQHELGQAVDIVFTSYRGTPTSHQQYFNTAVQIKNEVPYDQLLFEVRSTGSIWIHISFSKDSLRNQILTMYNDKVYAQGLVLI